jgi:glycosyltransferase involved in cell wall biosynthesis
MTFPHVSVIVPHYQDLGGLDRCLASLCAQSFPADQFEIIVADNNSPVGKSAVEAVIAGRAKLVIATQKGAGPARNCGVASATGTWLAFIDSDCVAHPKWLEQGLAALKTYDFVGGDVEVLVPPGQAMSGAEAFESVFAFNNKRYIAQEQFTITASLFCARKLFDDVGPFLVGVSEDKEWCHRAIGKGYRLGYCADAIIGHPARRNWRELKHKWRRIISESYSLTRQQKFGGLRWLARSWLVPVSIIPHAWVILRSRALPGGRERVAAIATLVRLRLWRFFEAHALLFHRSA